MFCKDFNAVSGRKISPKENLGNEIPKWLAGDSSKRWRRIRTQEEVISNVELLLIDKRNNQNCRK